MARGTWGGDGERHPHKVTISWTHLTSRQQTGFYMMATGATVANPATIAAEVTDWVNDQFRLLLGTGNRVLGVDVVDLVTREGASTSPSNMFGTQTLNAGIQLPAFLCATVNLKSELRTRYGQGRMFWPIEAEGQIDGDSLSATSMAAFQQVADDMASRFVGGSFAGYQLVTIHGPLAPRAATATSPGRPAIPASWYDVVSLRINSNVTALRSRKMTVGS